MQILETVKTVGDYGLSLILSAIVIYVIIKLLKIQFDKLQAASKRKEHDNALALRSEIDEKVYEILNHFIEEHKGLRLQVIEFTNTVTSVAYLPFKYMSCTYEVVSYGNKPEARCIDKLSTSLFTPFLSMLGKKEYVMLDYDSAEHLSGVVHDLFKEIGGDHMISVMMKSDKDKCIGYVSFYKDKPIQENDTTDLVVIGAKLATLLGVLDK